jgi:dTDP-4-dehydrorhamnose reductase
MKSKTKIMIFGGCGFVGGNIAMQANAQGYEPILVDTERKPQFSNYKWHKCDITNKLSVNRVILSERPKAVINVAAIANIDFAQNNQELAYKVNAEGAKNIAKACKEAGSAYVFFSSDAVFRGDDSIYAEDGIPDPVNYYGETKYQAEKAITDILPEAKIIRISLVLGFPLAGGNSFYLGLKSKLESGQDILCPMNEIRTPIDVTTLAKAVLELALNDYSGILHIGATSSISRFELTCRVAELMGYSRDIVIKMDKEAVAKRTPRHNNGILDVTKASAILKTEMPTIEDAIQNGYETLKNII